MAKSKSLMLLFTKEQPERFAQVAHNKKATVSDSLTLLVKKERKCDSHKKANGSFAFAHKKRAIRSKNL